jgi:hypothetical protein
MHKVRHAGSGSHGSSPIETPEWEKHRDALALGSSKTWDAVEFAYTSLSVLGVIEETAGTIDECSSAIAHALQALGQQRLTRGTDELIRDSLAEA